MQDANSNPFGLKVRLKESNLEEHCVSEPESVSDGAEGNDEMFSLDEIEAAYQLALDAADAVEDDPLFAAEMGALENTDVEDVLPLANPQASEATARQAAVDEDALSTPHPAPDVTPLQVLEALLFVGGSPLPAKRLAEILGGQTTHAQVDELLEQLNNDYLQTNRPYEVRLVEGGYRLSLREQFEGVRRKVYGQGPKEVKLTQEVLEILAFVAYQQPVSRDAIEATGRKNIPSLLRGLLRRELISLDRGEAESQDYYRTTARFLELFGLATLEDLPQAVDFNFK